MTKLTAKLLGPEWHCVALVPRIAPPKGAKFGMPVVAFPTVAEREEFIAQHFTANLARTHAVTRSEPIRARRQSVACQLFAYQVAEERAV